MKPNNTKQPVLGWGLFWGLLALSLVSFAAHLIVYPALPDQVPRQWSLSGGVNSWMSKEYLWLLDALPLAMVILFKVIPAIEPRADSYRKMRGLWGVFVTVMTLLMIGFTWMTELYFWGPESLWGYLPAAVICLIGAGLVALGNYMPRIRQNYTMGVRTPWALASDHCWQRTQRMGGICFVIIGLLMILSTLIDLATGFGISGFVTVASLFVCIAWLYVYSWLVFIGKMK